VLETDKLRRQRYHNCILEETVERDKSNGWLLMSSNRSLILCTTMFNGTISRSTVVYVKNFIKILGSATRTSPATKSGTKSGPNASTGGTQKWHKEPVIVPVT
jgi:hypothetical protein